MSTEERDFMAEAFAAREHIRELRGTLIVFADDVKNAMTTEQFGAAAEWAGKAIADRMLNVVKASLHAMPDLGHRP